MTAPRYPQPLYCRSNRARPLGLGTAPRRCAITAAVCNDVSARVAGLLWKPE
jgi:hypothetical protein